MSPASHIAAFRRSNAALDSANAALNAANANVAEHEVRTHANAERLAAIAAEHVERALTVGLRERSARLPTSATEIDGLRAEAAVADRIAAELKQRAARARSARDAAEKVRNEAARQYLCVEAIDPARAEFAAAFEVLREAACKLMGTHHAAYVAFGKDGAGGFYTADSMYGPAAQFVRHLSEQRRVEHPYSVRPGWLSSYDFHPYKLEGVNEAERAAIAKVEGERA